MNKNVKIIIVDDDEQIRATMKTILEDNGYVVDLAATGNEAIKMTQETVYNVALLDIRLPDIEGVELLKRIKDNVPKTRKIMVTGYPTLQNAISALNKNADAYLVKPFDVEKLLNLIKEQLRLQEDEKKFSEQKVAEFIATRVEEISV